ncbi:unnamed protein product [Porites evermanni]|uniref:Uncharacterized protein n=1 Tax=Porites evermanni TaxID=104178 RepID=A0ABN8LZ17_9CNID|nr:unnamed protein product [Porites evermanni]
MLTLNAKTSMNSTGKDTNTGKDADPSNTEFVSLATLREMLQIQKQMFKNMFESLLSSVNTRIDKVVKSVSELKASLEYSQQDIDDLKEATDAIDDMDEELEKNWKISRTKAEEIMSILMEFTKKTTRPS